MTISFFSNFLNDHQLPFCLELVRRIGNDNFRFIAHERIADDRIKMGFENMNETYPFVIKAYEGGDNESLAKRLMITSDVVIIGSSNGMPYKERLQNGKLTFRYHERLLKKGFIKFFDPRLILSVYKRFIRFRSSIYPLYVLCASAYTSRDLSFFGFPSKKCLKWGYFPKLKEYQSLDRLILSKENNSILWVGRLIDWKQPQIAIEVAKKLKEDGVKFSLNIIGTGVEQDSLRRCIDNYDLCDNVHLLGPLPPERVREYMEKSKIFLFTSNKQEGWGAVLNESLNSACVVFANKAIGSVPFMLDDGVNGFVYSDTNELYEKLINSFGDYEKTISIAHQAYRTVHEIWNARNAVDSLFQVIDRLNKKQSPFLLTGPCSKC